jgi:hypothetical protein
MMISTSLKLFPDLVCQSPDLPVLKGYLPIIGDEQDTVIRYGFFAFGCVDTDVVWLKADIGAADARPVIGSTPIGIPYPHFSGIVAVIVPVLLEEFMAGQHGSPGIF